MKMSSALSTQADIKGAENVNSLCIMRISIRKIPKNTIKWNAKSSTLFSSEEISRKQTVSTYFGQINQKSPETVCLG